MLVLALLVLVLLLLYAARGTARDFNPGARTRNPDSRITTWAFDILFLRRNDAPDHSDLILLRCANAYPPPQMRTRPRKMAPPRMIAGEDQVSAKRDERRS